MSQIRKLAQHRDNMIGKIFGAGLGWVLGGGPIGAAIGLAIGAVFDKTEIKKINTAESAGSGRPNTSRGDFNASLIVLSAAVMKADGKVLKSELNFVKQFLLSNFGEQIAKEQLALLKQLLKQDLDVIAISQQIRFSMRINEKRLILQYLFGIAAADQELHNSELRLLSQIASLIGISQIDFNSIHAMFAPGNYSQGNSQGGSRARSRSAFTDISTSYKILGLQKGASKDEVKKAYRKLVVKHHPDKVSHLGEDHFEAANKKFKKIQGAYEEVMKTFDK